jgi:regulatory protein SWI6
MQVARSAVSSSFPAGSPPQAQMYTNSPHGLMAAPAAFNRSFSDMNGFQQHQMEKPQIYTVRATNYSRRDGMLTN